MSLKEATTTVPESKVKFFDTTAGKSAKTALYLGLSSIIGYLVAQTTSDPVIYGATLTPVINLVLVFVKNLVDPQVKNV